MTDAARVLVAFISLPVVYETLRIIATGLGAVIVWFAAAPLARTLVRLAFQRPLPQSGQALARVLGAAAAAVLIYWLLPLGGGGEGSGTGGGGPGGPGGGGPQAQTTDKSRAKGGERPGANAAAETPKDVLLIEIGYEGDDKYYLIQRKKPAVTLVEVDAFLEKHQQAYRMIHIIITRDSRTDREGPIEPLRRLANDKYRMVARVPAENEKPAPKMP